MLQYNAWLVAQNSNDWATPENTATDPLRTATFHTEMVFRSMWEAADVLTTRHIEV
jgi:hypothetical protein